MQQNPTASAWNLFRYLDLQLYPMLQRPRLLCSAEAALFNPWDCNYHLQMSTAAASRI